jgi:hypothetical protein
MLHRRRPTVLAFALALLLSTVTVGQNVPPSDEFAIAAEDRVLQASLVSLFDTVAAEAQVTMHPDGSGSVPAATVEVLVAKIGPDGKVVTACVNDTEGIKRFLAPKQRMIDGAREEK